MPKATAKIHHATASGGGALDTKTQHEMGSRFGHDFSQVRIHTDTRAAESAQALGANAYAVGSDIVFGSGRYAPGSADGDRLLAHELTHVVQQARYGAGDPSRPSQRGDASEQEAESAASQVMLGQRVQVQAMPGAAIARDGESIWDKLKPGGSGILQGGHDGSWDPSGPSGIDWDKLKPGGSGILQGSEKGSWNPSGTEPADQARNSAIWDTLGIIPGIGTVTSGISTAIDLGSAAYHGATGKGDAAKDLKNAALDGLGMLPIVGSVLSAEEATVDWHATSQREAGASAADAPTYSDMWVQGMPTMKDITSPFTDPDSWIPQGPSQ